MRYHLILNGEATEFILQGPAVVLETTTNFDGIDFQNRNRGFVVQFDTSKVDLDSRVESVKCQWLSPEAERANSEIVTQHREFQTLLDHEMRVTIPFAQEIKLNVKYPHEQRLFENFLRLVAAIAFLQQTQRVVSTTSSGVRFIEATRDDYAEAYKLVHAVPLETGDELLSEEAVKPLLKIKSKSVLNSTTPFTRRKISQSLEEWTPKRVCNHIHELIGERSSQLF